MNLSILKTVDSTIRMRLEIEGAVQGVGFRPFVYQLATKLKLTGWIHNSGQGIVIEIEGPIAQLDNFMNQLNADKPPSAYIVDIHRSQIDLTNDTRFEIVDSESLSNPTAWILPDLATCEECLGEIRDRHDRRYQYPFTNCTRCGPRYSIMTTLPYDRPGTSMSRFTMCEACRSEYENPADRRFHAQPNACPQCGPHVEFWTPEGHLIASLSEAVEAAVAALRNQKIIAVKGLGGFHLMVDARNEMAIHHLRQVKHRSEKPFATMFPSLERIQAVCETQPLEEALLCSPQAPIVLLKKKPGTTEISLEQLAPHNRYLGVMLPNTPLHHILMQELGFPVVATSGNVSEETLCTDNSEAVARLGSMVDGFLMHNRDIVHPVDDSVVRVMMEQMTILRRARGYSPLPLLPPPTDFYDSADHSVILAVGSHLKNSIAVSNGPYTVTSPHIGDLESAQTQSTFKSTIEQLQQLYSKPFSCITCDFHPDYASSRYAANSDLRRISVQHHYAHVLSCMVDNQLNPPVLGIAWDGSGYGEDGSIWGGEFLYVDENTFHRAGYLRPFSLPGSHQAIREPRRSALGILYETFDDAAFDLIELAPMRSWAFDERAILMQMLTGKINSPRTSSAGRLFDAVASLLNIRQTVSYEGQAAMELEEKTFSTGVGETHSTCYSFATQSVDSALVLDWEPMIRELFSDLQQAVPTGFIALKFHNTLVEMMVALAHQVKEKQIVLTGGCFQNCYLTERAIHRLREEGFKPFWHHQMPPNDGGIAVGQIAGARRELRREIS